MVILEKWYSVEEENKCHGCCSFERCYHKDKRRKQGRHIKTSPAYIEGRSYNNETPEAAQRLVDELSGTGIPLMDAHGNWLHKERVQADYVIGANVDPDTGKETKTGKGMIIYSKTGTHIFPRKEEDE